ncbi:MAG: chromosome segregation protein SMC [Methylobacter sp.]|nr:MAG: chromosome segregation protein SMC [Methylobacter sp.]
MKLEKIKLSGFKSFVDPTVIPINGNLTAIVGPNGCGKSNIIDAVRWVMGESSAKHLRGGSMADVIFNGSSGRKPVNTASVELVFDNTERKLGGEYAQYDSISIKRQVSRDGQSLYLLNGSRCRRKDITDIFLGTGLGSRSYAIIEQGTISRMVEAKPDELRIHIEEAAGVSKYKERRQETESRMKHTRENLERLDDLRDEVEKQLKHLQKQAEKAEKYTELKKLERQLRLELLAMRWKNYDGVSQTLDYRLQTIAQTHNQLFISLRDIEAELEQKRIQYKQQQQQTDSAQGNYYQVVADVSGLEQAIRLNEMNHEEVRQEINRLQGQAEHFSEELQTDLQQLEELKQAAYEAEATLVVAGEELDCAQQAQQDILGQRAQWQQHWDEFRTQSAKFNEEAEILRLKIHQLETQNRQLKVRHEKLELERGELSVGPLEAETAALARAIEQLENHRSEVRQQLELAHQKIGQQRQHIKQTHDDLHDCRLELQAVNGKITSLELLQQHAMGKDNRKLMDWLAQLKLENAPRLVEFTVAEQGWELAVETVLGLYLEAICLDDMSPVLAALPQLQDQSISLLKTASASRRIVEPALPLLSDKINSPWDLQGLLTGIYCADDLAEAVRMSATLKPYESVITRDGTWLGQGWLKINRQQDAKAGVLVREQELKQFRQQKALLVEKIDQLSQLLESAEADLKSVEINRETAQKYDAQLAGELSDKTSQQSGCSARLEQQRRRLSQLSPELDEIVQELADNAEYLLEHSDRQTLIQAALAEFDDQRNTLESANQQLQIRQQEAQRATDEARQKLYNVKSRLESLQSSENLAAKQIERLKLQHEHTVDRIQELTFKLSETLKPLDNEKQQLTELTAAKARLETGLKVQRQAQEHLEKEITALSERYLQTQKALEAEKEALDKLRFELQESKVRRQTVQEQLNEIDADISQVIQLLPEHAEESLWKRQVDELAGQIERLGTINLTAIEEYQSQAERMAFLNAQHDDLTEALQTLEQAISKIDKESKLRFKETFDKINSGLQEKFPKLFGGGQAYLELSEAAQERAGESGSDGKPAADLWSEAGVNIIARPPGKRNSSIHLLSGGEKALTAVALVFSIFELNPAPFCLLDEVDAPLDDANVGRFSKMVEEMSKTVQFLYISHNKATMEIAKQLAGVTMKEPGVSRMVAVDIEEAVSMAET